MSKIHQSNPNARADQDFAPGELKYLVVGNACRLLDRRRTPGRIESLSEGTGFFRWRILDFEDAGKFWDVPIEDVGRFQFELNSRVEADGAVADLRARIMEFHRPLIVEASPAEREATERRLAENAEEIADWMRSRFGSDLRSERTIAELGDEISSTLATIAEEFMHSQGVADQERLTAEIYVLNPRSGEWIKGMEIVLAEMGMKDYRGTAVRSKTLFEGKGERELRRRYLSARLSFMRAMFALLGRREVKLYRGMSSEGAWRAADERFFSSWSFSRDVAESFASFAADDRVTQSYLIMRTTPIHRLFMTFLETRAMNRQYHEAEAVVIHTELDRQLC